jgi:hypothetical protein
MKGNHFFIAKRLVAGAKKLKSEKNLREGILFTDC